MSTLRCSELLNLNVSEDISALLLIEIYFRFIVAKTKRCPHLLHCRFTTHAGASFLAALQAESVFISLSTKRQENCNAHKQISNCVHSKIFCIENLMRKLVYVVLLSCCWTMLIGMHAQHAVSNSFCMRAVCVHHCTQVADLHHSILFDLKKEDSSKLCKCKDVCQFCISAKPSKIALFENKNARHQGVVLKIRCLLGVHHVWCWKLIDDKFCRLHGPCHNFPECLDQDDPKPRVHGHQIHLTNQSEEEKCSTQKKSHLCMQFHHFALNYKRSLA